MNMPEPLCLVIPVFNESSSLPRLIESLQPIWRENHTYLLFVNDGSTDSTEQVLAAAHSNNENLGYISLSRNFGKELAIAAGLDQVPPHYHALVMDGDGQHSLTAVQALLAQAAKSPAYNIVFGARRKRGYQSLPQRLLSKAYYRLLTRLSHRNYNPDLGDFFIASPETVKVLRKFKDRRLYWKGIYGWAGFGHHVVKIDIEARRKGKSKFTPLRKALYALDGILLTSTFLLRAISVLGVIVSVISLVTALIFILQYFAYGISTPGFYTLIVFQGVIGGVILLSLGIIAQYLAIIYENSSDKPRYLISPNSQRPIWKPQTEPDNGILPDPLD